MKKSSKKTWIVICSCAIAVMLTIFSVLFFCIYLPKKRAIDEWNETVKEYYDAKLYKYQQENLLYEDYQVEVAFLGDSLTDGYDLNKYFPQYLTSNRGISGETTFGLENRLQVSVIDLKPKVAVMLIGANNMDKMFDNYENILIKLKTELPITKIVLLSLTAMGGERWGRKNQLAAYNNVKIELLADKYGYYFIDLFSPLYDVDTGEVYKGLTYDGGHLTNEGYLKVTEQITPVLYEILGK